MTTSLDGSAYTLLVRCAVLHWFDRRVLLALTDTTEAAVDWLLTSDLVVQVDGRADVFRLRPDVQAEVPSSSSADPFAESLVHTRAFEYFLAQMQQVDPLSRRHYIEDACIYHLDKLFFFLLQRSAWHKITEYTRAVQTVGLQQRRHLQRIALYEGYVAVCTQNYERGEAILTTLLAEPHLQDDLRLHGLRALAEMHRNLTRYDQALAIYEQLSQWAQATANPVFHGLALINMSSVYHELEYYERALDLATQSLHIFRMHGEQTREAFALYIVGLNAMYLGRWQIAQDYFDAAIQLSQLLGIETSLALLYWSQGYLNHLLGNESASEAAYLRALPLSQSPEYAEPLLTMDTWLQLGFLYHTQERYDLALSNYERALDVASHLRHEHRIVSIHYQRGNVFKVQGRFDEAFAAYNQAITVIKTLRGATEGEEIKIGLLGTTQQVFEAMVLLCLEQDRLTDAFNYVERARSRAFLDTLIKKSPELYEALDQPVTTLAEVQARLPSNAVLVEYFTTGVLPRGEHLINTIPSANTRLREHLTLPAQVVIFAITRERFEVHLAPINPNTLRPQLYDPGPGRRFLQGRLPVYLYEQLLDPVQHLITGRDLLFLIPHGPLHYVPFMALCSANGDHLLDPDGPAIALAPSATILLRNCLNRPTNRAAGFFALGYNDPTVSLQYAEVEAHGVARLMGGTAWTGPEPKLHRLLSAGAQARWIHLAGHASYNPHDPLDSAIQLGRDDPLSARAIIGQLELNADLITLSACTTGISSVVPGDELLGLPRAFLYAGAPTVVCTLWEAYDLVALLVMEYFYTNLRAGHSAASALRDAQVAVRQMSGSAITASLERWRQLFPEAGEAIDDVLALFANQSAAQPFADPRYWAPFMLIGRP